MERRGNADVGEIEIVEEVPVYQNRYCTVYDDRVRFPSGVEGTYVRVVWRSASSVAILPVDPTGRLILLRVFRHAAREWVLEVPKGFSDGREPAVQAEIELREETGMIARRLRPGLTLRSDPGGLSGVLHTYVAEDARVVGEPRTEAFETIQRSVAFTPADARAAIADGTIVDAVTVAMLLWWFAQSGQDSP